MATVTSLVHFPGYNKQKGLKSNFNFLSVRKNGFTKQKHFIGNDIFYMHLNSFEYER